jgi:hypothetical protein
VRVRMEAAMKIALALVLAAALAPTVASAAAGDACFRTREISSHRKGADDKTLYLKVGLKDVYKVTSKNACLAGAMRDDGLVVGAPPSGMVCKAIDFDLAIRQGGGHATPCLVESIVKLTPQEAAALPKDVRP